MERGQNNTGLNFPLYRQQVLAVVYLFVQVLQHLGADVRLLQLFDPLHGVLLLNLLVLLDLPQSLPFLRLALQASHLRVVRTLTLLLDLLLFLTFLLENKTSLLGKLQFTCIDKVRIPFRTEQG